MWQDGNQTSTPRAIRLDVHTAQRARGKFARMCVELDLTKPLIPEFNVEGQTLSIVYESLGCLCTKCGMIGHRKEACGEAQRQEMNGGMEVEVDGEKVRAEEVKECEVDRWKTGEDSGEERRGAQILKKPVNEGPMGKSVRDGTPGQPRVPGNQGSRGDTRKGMESFISKDKGEAMQEGKTAREASSFQARGVGGRGSILKEKRVSMSNQGCAPESNLEIQRWQEAHLSGKENIKPGEHVEWRRKMDNMDTGQDLAAASDVGQSDGIGLSLEGVYATPALAD
ncbi:hypothetical protein K1719_029672 [Acacia pycnantha]|nr:hypothetical protein K1719_029672 [Acacia pycnantha]